MSQLRKYFSAHSTMSAYTQLWGLLCMFCQRVLLQICRKYSHCKFSVMENNIHINIFMKYSTKYGLTLYFFLVRFRFGPNGHQHDVKYSQREFGIWLHVNPNVTPVCSICHIFASRRRPRGAKSKPHYY